MMKYLDELNLDIIHRVRRSAYTDILQKFLQSGKPFAMLEANDILAVSTKIHNVKQAYDNFYKHTARGYPNIRITLRGETIYLINTDIATNYKKEKKKND